LGKLNIGGAKAPEREAEDLFSAFRLLETWTQMVNFAKQTQKWLFSPESQQNAPVTQSKRREAGLVRESGE
jgi:hypothetical protein